MRFRFRLLHNYVQFRIDHPELTTGTTQKDVRDLAHAHCNGVLNGRDKYFTAKRSKSFGPS